MTRTAHRMAPWLALLLAVTGIATAQGNPGSGAAAGAAMRPADPGVKSGAVQQHGTAQQDMDRDQDRLREQQQSHDRDKDRLRDQDRLLEQDRDQLRDQEQLTAKERDRLQKQQRLHARSRRSSSNSSAP